MRWIPLVVALLCLWVIPAAAVQPDEILSDSQLEARARTLTKELRCMVCQNQSIDDSDAPLARDLRLLVRERLQAGDSNQEVIDFLVARYGEFVLLRPRFSAHTAILWLTPIGILLIGVFAFVLLARKPAKPDTNLTPHEETRLSEILRRDEILSLERTPTHVEWAKARPPNNSGHAKPVPGHDRGSRAPCPRGEGLGCRTACARRALKVAQTS